MASTNPGSTLATLTLRQGPLSGQRFAITKSSVTIGRAADNDIVISDTELSRHHARLSWDGQQFIIEDLGSTNGTSVDDVPIDARQPLVSGARLGLGGLRLDFHSSVSSGPSEQVTHSGIPVRQAPRPVYQPGNAAPAQARGGGLRPWMLIVGLGAALVLLLAATGLAALLLYKPAGPPPTVQISSPVSGDQVAVNQAMSIVALAEDGHGVTRVEFWVDGELEDSMSSPGEQGQDAYPVQFRWTAEVQGSHILQLRVYNRNGQNGESAPLIIKAIPPVEPTESLPAAPTGALVLVVPTPTGQTLLVQDTPNPSPEPPTQECVSNLVFVADMTVPDYSQVQPGQSIDKIWRVRNSGTCPWDAGYQLAYAGGDQMGALSSHGVAPTAPDGQADLQVALYAPAAPGTYQGFWQLRDGAGQPVGSALTVIIVVPSTVAPSPSVPTPTTIPPWPDVPQPDTPNCTPSIDFRASSDAIDLGQSTTLRWDVECVREVYFQGGAVTGHESREVTPEETTTYVLRVVRNDGSNEERRLTVTVTVDEPEIFVEDPNDIDATISYHSYDAATRWVTLKVISRGYARLESAEAAIKGAGGLGYLYGPAYSNTPFRDGPASDGPVDSVAPFDTKYMRYRLKPAPSGTEATASITLYAGENRSGASVAKSVGFTLP